MSQTPVMALSINKDFLFFLLLYFILPNNFYWMLVSPKLEDRLLEVKKSPLTDGHGFTKRKCIFVFFKRNKKKLYIESAVRLRFRKSVFGHNFQTRRKICGECCHYHTKVIIVYSDTHVFLGPLNPGEALMVQYLRKCWRWGFE